MVTRNLVIVHTPGAQALSDWVTVREKITAQAPDVDVRIVPNQTPSPQIISWQTSRSSLVFSACQLKFTPVGGKIFAGGPMDKLAEIRRLEDAGIPTPRTMLLTPSLSLDPAIWGEYLVAKPASLIGMRGRGIALVRADSAGSRFEELTANGRLRMLVQQLIDATDAVGRLCAYRVLTMFGRPLYASKTHQVQPRLPLAEIYNRRSNVIAHNAEGVRRQAELVKDQDLLELAVQTAKTMGEFPVLGIDIVRHQTTGALYVLETNSTGLVWHLSSTLALKLPAKFNRKKYAQFGALDVAADTLVEKTRQHASLLLLP
jgi:hypothetical protein